MHKTSQIVIAVLLLAGTALILNNCGGSGGIATTTTTTISSSATTTTLGSATTTTTGQSITTTSAAQATTTSTSATSSTSTTSSTATTSTSTTTTTLMDLDPDDPTATLRSIDSDWIPFAYYNINEDAGYLEVFTSEARINSVKVLYTPFRSHADPFSGHHSGNAGSNWLGYLASQESELVSFGQTVGMLKTDIDPKIPYYICPVDSFTITDLWYQPASSDQYYGVEQWIVKGNNGYVEIYYDHCRKLHSSFITKVIAAGNTDPRETGSLPQNENLITSTFTLNAGDNVAQPQVLGREVMGNTDYWTSFGNSIPHLQIEFAQTDPGGTPIYNPYWLVSSNKTTSFMQAFYTAVEKSDLEQDDMFNDFLNTGTLDGEEFWWRAEVTMEPSYINTWDNSSVFDGVQTWYEVINAGDSLEEINSYTPGDSLNNDSFTIFPINKNPRVFDASLYSSADVSYLVQKIDDYDGGNKVGPHVGEVLDTSTVEATSGQLLIHWKFANDQILNPDTYQAASYSLDTSNYVLKIRWGSEEASLDNVSVLPIPDTGDTADGSTIIQYKQDGFYSGSIYGYD